MQISVALLFLLIKDIECWLKCYCNHGKNCVGNVCRTEANNNACYTMLDKNHKLVKGCTALKLCYNPQERPLHGDVFDCCSNTDMCNMNVTKETLRHYKDHPKQNTTASPATNNETTEYSVTQIAVMVAVPLSSLFIAAAIVLLLVNHRKKKASRNNTRHRLLVHEDEHYDDLNLTDITTSGSGAGLPLLVQRTIARQIVLYECIGRGGFGDVHRGTWKSQDVAVKIFSTDEEASWFREYQIYQTTMLRHENVLGFIAADNKDTGACTQLWLVCEFHANGSLYDYLHAHTLSVQELFTMILSIVNGLAHLHMEVIGTQGKPAMAHRDLKSKNILVKANKTCCIADLGLAVLHTSFNDKVDMPAGSRTGTVRYLSPEILCDKFNVQHFDSYRKADVYSLGLCMWEMCRRTDVCGDVGEYELPYFDAVKPDPSPEEMNQAVVVENKRPKFEDNWKENATMKTIMNVITECWYRDAAARLSVLRIKKNLLAAGKQLSSSETNF